MQKKLVLAVVFISLLVLSMSFASAFSFSTIVDKIKSFFSGPQLSPEDERSVTYSCSGDSSSDVYSVGSIAVAVLSCDEAEFARTDGESGCMSYADTITDSCVDENNLMEVSCVNGIIDEREVECPNGCLDGMCKNPETECSDGVDNDGDGATDCADSDCSGYQACMPPACYSDSDCGSQRDITYCDPSGRTCTNSVTPRCNNAGMQDASCYDEYGAEGCSNCDYGCNSENGQCNSYDPCSDSTVKVCDKDTTQICYDPYTGDEGTQGCNSDCSGWSECVPNQKPECYQDSDCGQNEEIKYCADNYVCSSVIEPFCENAGETNAVCSARYSESGCEPSPCEFGCDNGECKPYVLCNDEMNRACYSEQVQECGDPATGILGIQTCSDDCSGFLGCTFSVTPACYSDSDCQPASDTYCEGDFVCVDTPVQVCNNAGQLNAYCSEIYTMISCYWSPCPWGCSDGKCNDNMCNNEMVRACVSEETMPCQDATGNTGVSTCLEDCSGWGECVPDVAPACYSDSDCGEYREMPATCDEQGYICQGAVLPVCNNAGRADAYCDSIILGGCSGTPCEFGCANGQCLNQPPECDQDSDCALIVCDVAPCPVNVCENGKCVAKVLDTCFDSDAGPEDYNNYGEVYLNDAETPTFVDNCDGNVLNEGSCKEGIISSSGHECGEGTCSNGACIPITPECTNSDYSNCGGSSVESQCVGNYIFVTSRQPFCENEKCNIAINTELASSPCVYGCVDGKCLAKNDTQPCIPVYSIQKDPVICLTNGVQTETITDTKCGTGSITKQVSCTPSSCSGCDYNSQCIPYQYRLTLNGVSGLVPSYCSDEGTIKAQISPGDSCQDGYQCKSNVCSSGKCVDIDATIQEVGTLKKIVIELFCRISSIFDNADYDQCVATNSVSST